MQNIMQRSENLFALRWNKNKNFSFFDSRPRISALNSKPVMELRSSGVDSCCQFSIELCFVLRIWQLHDPISACLILQLIVWLLKLFALPRKYQTFAPDAIHSSDSFFFFSHRCINCIIQQEFSPYFITLLEMRRHHSTDALFRVKKS